MKKRIIIVFIFFINILPCFSGEPYILEKGFYYMWSDADVYDGPGFTNKVIATLQLNTKIEVLNWVEHYVYNEAGVNVTAFDQLFDNWYEVNANGVNGYIFGRNIASERIVHIDKYGVEYIYLFYYYSTATKNYNGYEFYGEEFFRFGDNEIKILANGRDINFRSPTKNNIVFKEENRYFEYASDYNINGYSYQKLFFSEANVFTLISRGYGEHTLVFQYTINNFGIEKVYIDWHWANKGGEYDDSITLKWDNEKQIYYEIEGTPKEQFVEENINPVQTINHDNGYYSETEVFNSYSNTKPPKTSVLDKVANKIMSNKIITYGIILFLLGLFIFVLYKRRCSLA